MLYITGTSPTLIKKSFSLEGTTVTAGGGGGLNTTQDLTIPPTIQTNTWDTRVTSAGAADAANSWFVNRTGANISTVLQLSDDSIEGGVDTIYGPLSRTGDPSRIFRVTGSNGAFADITTIPGTNFQSVPSSDPAVGTRFRFVSVAGGQFSATGTAASTWSQFIGEFRNTNGTVTVQLPTPASPGTPRLEWSAELTYVAATPLAGQINFTNGGTNFLVNANINTGRAGALGNFRSGYFATLYDENGDHIATRIISGNPSGTTVFSVPVAAWPTNVIAGLTAGTSTVFLNIAQMNPGTDPAGGSGTSITVTQAQSDSIIQQVQGISRGELIVV